MLLLELVYTIIHAPPIGKRYLQGFYGLLINRFIHCWNGVKKGKKKTTKERSLKA